MLPSADLTAHWRPTLPFVKTSFLCTLLTQKKRKKVCFSVFFIFFFFLFFFFTQHTRERTVCARPFVYCAGSLRASTGDFLTLKRGAANTGERRSPNLCCLFSTEAFLRNWVDAYDSTSVRFVRATVWVCMCFALATSLKLKKKKWRGILKHITRILHVKKGRNELKNTDGDASPKELFWPEPIRPIP